MKRFLFMDDDQDRHIRFAHMLTLINDQTGMDHECVHLDTATQCITTIKQEKFDCIFLDHDLCINGRWDLENGMDVVDFMSLHLDIDKWPRNIVIHSHNDTKADVMWIELNRAANTLTKNIIPITKCEFPSFFSKTDKEFESLLKDIINA